MGLFSLPKRCNLDLIPKQQQSYEGPSPIGINPLHVFTSMPMGISVLPQLPALPVRFAHAARL